jgi:hypothetical protein
LAAKNSTASSPSETPKRDAEAQMKVERHQGLRYESTGKGIQAEETSESQDRTPRVRQGWKQASGHHTWRIVL